MILYDQDALPVHALSVKSAFNPLNSGASDLRSRDSQRIGLADRGLAPSPDGRNRRLDLVFLIGISVATTR